MHRFALDRWTSQVFSIDVLIAGSPIDYSFHFTDSILGYHLLHSGNLFPQRSCGFVSGSSGSQLPKSHNCRNQKYLTFMKNRFSEEEKLKRSMNSKNNFYCMFRSSLFIYSIDLYRYLPDGRFSGKDYIKIVARYLSGPYNKMCQEYGKKRINNWLQSRYLRIRSDLFQPVMPSPHIIHTNGKKKIVIKDSIQYWQKRE